MCKRRTREWTISTPAPACAARCIIRSMAHSSSSIYAIADIAARTPAPRMQRICSLRMPSCNGSARSEEHTSELQSLIRNSYAVVYLKTKHQCQHLVYIADILLDEN